MSYRFARIIPTVSVLLFVIFLLAQGFYCFKRPVNTVDSMLYVSLLEGGNQQAFRETGQICNLQLPGSHNGCEIGTSRAFQEISSYSPGDFATFLRFYRVKPLYTWFAMLLHKLFHLRSYLALRVVSSGSYVFIGIMIALWLQKHLSTPAACLAALLIACTPPVLNLGKALLPDAFSTALMLPVIYAILYRTRNLWVQLGLLALLPFARPDNILFCAFFGAVLVYRETQNRKWLVIRLFIVATSCVLLNTLLQRSTHALSYTILFSHSFLGWSPPGTYLNLHLSLHNYLRTVIVSGFKTIALYFPLPVLFAGLALADPTSWRPMRDLVAVTMVTVFVRLLLFPVQDERFYTWFLVIAATATAATIGQLVAPKESWFRRYPINYVAGVSSSQN